MAIIGKIRKNFGWGVTVIVALATLAFIFNDFGRQRGGFKDIASVDGMEIGIAEFDNLRELKENELKQQYSKLNNEQQYQAKTSAYYELVTEKILDRECEKLGIIIGEEEMNDMFVGTFVASEIRQNFTDPTTGQFNAQQVKQIMQQYNQLAPEQQVIWNRIQKNAYAERLNTKYASLLASSFYMPKAMAKHISDTYDQTTDVRYAVLPFSSIEDDKVKLTDEDYEKYYNEHKNSFLSSEEMRQVEFVKFDVIPSGADIQALTDSAQRVFVELGNTSREDMYGFISTTFENNYDSLYYEVGSRGISMYFPDTLLTGKGVGDMIEPRVVGDNWIMGKILDRQNRPDSIKCSAIAVYNNRVGASEIKRTLQEQTLLVDSLMNVIKDSAQFTENVTKFSDDPNSKKQFGDMGWIRDGYVEELYKQMINTNVGGIFRYTLPDSIGEYIIRVTDKTAAKPKIQMATVVIGIRPSEATINNYKNKADDFLAKSKDLTSMKNLASKQNNNVLTSTLSTMSYKLDGTPYAREIVCWAFGDVKEGEVSNIVYELQDDGAYNTSFVVVGLKEIQEKGFIPLKQLKENPQFERIVKAEKKAQMLIDDANKILKSATSINAFATTAKVTVDTVIGTDFSSYSFGRNGAEMRVIGTLSGIKNTGLQKTPIKGFNGIYVVEVDKIYKRAVKEDFNMIKQTYDNRMQQRMNQINPIAIIYRDAKVENNFIQYVSK